LAALEGLPVRSQVLQELALMVAERDH
jgi:hypothetical protein